MAGAASADGLTAGDLLSAGVQFVAIIVAALISIWTVRAAAEREHRRQVRLIVAELLAVARQVADVIDEVSDNAKFQQVPSPPDGLPHNDEDRQTAEIAKLKLDPLLPQLKAKGAIAELHVGYGNLIRVRGLTSVLEVTAEDIRRTARGGVFHVQSLKAAMSSCADDMRALEKSFTHLGGPVQRLRSTTFIRHLPERTQKCPVWVQSLADKVSGRNLSR